MTDFVSPFWEVYIAVLTLVSIVACAVFLYSQQKAKIAGGKVQTTGHVWDEDLAEWNNPLPNWWRWLFYITVVFSLAYLVFYPGLGIWKGTWNWTSAGQYAEEVKRAEQTIGPLYAKYASMELPQVAGDPAALAIGQNLYLNYCAQCHASDARGSRGFPNLTDGDWLYGGDPKVIVETITNGRNGVMPPLGAAIGGADGVKDVASYVLSLSELTHDSLRAQRGKEKFATVCAACHGADGKGNQALGAPNLTDKVWLYGGTEATIIETVNNGRNNLMPSFKERLGEQKIHLVAAYVWSLSNKGGSAAAAAGGK